ncbi:MAG TPA: aminotransferase class I/II-fold pyridoxal phosphate-dependent enzyme [Gammaproteobacteria bacterium]|nr:aminotransferase class I/II-fold pyridoxal phosphate-dependent enzyme [Gammaproteobacteria bacterium]
MSDASRLELDHNEMRAFGYRIVDSIADHWASLEGKPVAQTLAAGGVTDALAQPLPAQPDSLDAVLDELQREVFAHVAHVNHPRFFAFVPGPANFVGVMADALAAGYNVFTGTWLASSGATRIELRVVDWLRRACGLPDGAGGLFVSGGSMANIVGLAVARHRMLDGPDPAARIYFSAQTHASVERGLRLLGFADAQSVRLPVDKNFRLDLRALAECIRTDRAAGFKPFCIVANAGTTNTGAVDLLPELAALAREEKLWLHADGAFGAAAAISARGRSALAGLDQVDSLSIDPHKWLFQPFEIGCVLVRERDWLRAAFQVLPDYMRDTRTDAETINLGEYGPQLTRSFRALKLWMSLRIFGVDAMVAAVERGFALAERAEARLRALDGWHIASPAQMAIVAFRYAPASVDAAAADALNAEIVRRLSAGGFAMLSSTRLNDRVALRLCTINPRTTDADIDATVDHLDTLARAVAAERAGSARTAAANRL